MSQIEGQPPVIEEPQPAPIPAEGPQYASEDERLFAEEVDRRAAEERGGEPEPVVVDPVVEPVVVEPVVVDPVVEPVVVEPVVVEPVVSATPLPVVEPTPLATPEPVEQPDWYKELSEPAKLAFDAKQAELEQTQWQYSAVYGRLAPMQSEVDRLRQLSQQQPVVQQPTGERPTPNASTPIADFESKEFLEYAENYPDEAAQLKRLYSVQQANMQLLETKLDGLAQGLNQVQSVSTANAKQSELATLEERHPDWMTVRHSPEFNNWLNTQPDSVRPMVASEYASDCSYLLDRYKQDVYLYQLQQGTTGTPPADPSRVAANQTAAHRQTLINTPTPDPQGGGVGVPSGQRPAQTAEQMWVEELERRARAQKKQRM